MRHRDGSRVLTQRTYLQKDFYYVILKRYKQKAEVISMAEDKKSDAEKKKEALEQELLRTSARSKQLLPGLLKKSSADEYDKAVKKLKESQDKEAKLIAEIDKLTTPEERAKIKTQFKKADEVLRANLKAGGFM